MLWWTLASTAGEFIDENGGGPGPGVRLQKRQQKNDLANPGTGQASNRAGLAMVSSCVTMELQNEPKVLGSNFSTLHFGNQRARWSLNSCIVYKPVRKASSCRRCDKVMLQMCVAVSVAHGADSMRPVAR